MHCHPRLFLTKKQTRAAQKPKMLPRQGSGVLLIPWGTDLRGADISDRKGFSSPVIKVAEKTSFDLRFSKSRSKGKPGLKAKLWLCTRL